MPYTEANSVGYYLWDNGELKHERVQASGERAGQFYANPSSNTVYHDQRDVQKLAEQIADIWVNDVVKDKGFLSTSSSQEKRNWRRNQREARSLYIKAFISSYNVRVKEYELQKAAEREAVSRRREESVFSLPPQPVYTPPSQPKSEPPTVKPTAPTVTVKRVERNPDEYVYYLALEDPGYIEGAIEPDEPLVYDLLYDEVTGKPSSQHGSYSSAAGPVAYSVSPSRVPGPAANTGSPVSNTSDTSKKPKKGRLHWRGQ